LNLSNISQNSESEKEVNEKQNKNKNTDLPVSTAPEKKSTSNFFTDKIEIIKYTMKLIQQHGILGLYDGMTSSIVGSVVQYAIYFCASKFWSYSLDYMDIKISGIGRTMLINLVAATCTAIVTNPIWVVNARMARKGKEVKNNFLNFLKIYYSNKN
jgi:hypothetical protein